MKFKIISAIMIICFFSASTSFNIYAKNNQDELLNKLKSLTSENIVDTYYDDFDCDGNFELIALVGDKHSGDEYYPSTFSGDVWLVSDYVGKAICNVNYGFGAVTQDNDDSYSYLKPCIINQNGNKILKLCMMYGNGSGYTILVYVKNSKDAFTQLIEGFLKEDNTVNVTAYDSVVEKDSLNQGDFSGSGRSWKDYWFYYDATDKIYKEYGAVEISKDDFLKFENSADILKNIDGKIYNILYRDNGIININYYNEFDNECSLCNILVSYNGNYVSIEKDEYDSIIRSGFYLKSIFGEYATYPTFINLQEQKSNNITVLFNGKELELSTPAIRDTTSGSVLVPIADIVDAMGGTSKWDNENKIATITKDNTEVKLQIGSSTAYVDGTSKALLAAPVISNGKTMVPLRFVAEAFGADVNWNGETNTVSINV